MALKMTESFLSGWINHPSCRRASVQHEKLLSLGWWSLAAIWMGISTMGRWRDETRTCQRRWVSYPQQTDVFLLNVGLAPDEIEEMGTTFRCARSTITRKLSVLLLRRALRRIPTPPTTRQGGRVFGLVNSFLKLDIIFFHWVAVFFLLSGSHANEPLKGGFLAGRERDHILGRW